MKSIRFRSSQENVLSGEYFEKKNWGDFKTFRDLVYTGLALSIPLKFHGISKKILLIKHVTTIRTTDLISHQ